MRGKTGILGAILGVVLSWLMGYLQPGAIVGAGGVGVTGGVASIGLSGLLGALGAASGGDWLKDLIGRITGKSGHVDVVPKPSGGIDHPILTAKVSESAFFFRQLMKDDDQAQVLIDELLVRCTRVCSGIDRVADFSISLQKTGGVAFSSDKAAKQGE